MPKVDQAVLDVLRTFPQGASVREVWDHLDAPARHSRHKKPKVTRKQLELLVKEHLARRDKDPQTDAVTYFPVLRSE